MKNKNIESVVLTMFYHSEFLILFMKRDQTRKQVTFQVDNLVNSLNTKFDNKTILRWWNMRSGNCIKKSAIFDFCDVIARLENILAW